ncbi:MAG: hypothetical protein A2Y33_06630 [Spirochaetes bacterium GWF1_51_8]|nr:MAG: hypothetical protein A2Y33_06630 [Spirochaetes bacterium GWF1_51_8]
MKKGLIGIVFTSVFLISCAGSAVKQGDGLPIAPVGEITVRLDIVQAFDSNLPMIGGSDSEQILSEAERILKAKFGSTIHFIFEDHGQIPVDDLFKDKTYQNTKLYESWKPYKYDLKLGKEMPVFSDPAFKKQVVSFLQMFSLASLSNYFPGVAIKDYDHAAELVMGVYHSKILWLKTLKTAKGKPVLYPDNPAQQSFVEWYTMMEKQDRYDIVIANSLIVMDLITSPFPHSVCKHAKVGGANFNSPARKAFDGNAVMINILEEYGNIPGISAGGKPLSNEMKNKVIGAVLLAHEIGHAFFHIPDVYDHPLSCLMNTPSAEVSYPELYRLLLEDLTPCPKCQPWVEAKQYSLMADQEDDLVKKGDLYLACAQKTMDLMGEGMYKSYDQKVYIARLFTLAREAYEDADDKKKIQSCDKLYYSIFKK